MCIVIMDKEMFQLLFLFQVCKIHRKLKMGNILVFVTGQREVLDMCHKLRNTFPMSTPHKHKHAAVENRIPSSNEMKKRDLKIDLDELVPVWIGGVAK